jgi:hypothetical protein
MVGDLWLATFLRFLSAQPSRASVRPRLLTLLFITWNGTVIATGVTFLLRGEVRARGVELIPFAGTVSALVMLALVGPVMVRRLSGIAPVSWHHLGAVATLVVGLGLGDLAFASNSLRTEAAGYLLVVGGWLPLAAVCLFYAAFDYEPYEDHRWPLVSAVALGVAALARFAFPYEVLNENGLDLFTVIAGLGLLFALANVLRSRWRGGMSYWYERLALAGTLVLVIAVFFDLGRPYGTPVGPGTGVPPAPPLVGVSFYATVVLWAAACAVMLDQRDLPRHSARLVLWPIAVGGLGYPLTVRLSSLVTDSVARGLEGLGAVAIGVGVLVVASHLLRRPRLRAVR